MEIWGWAGRPCLWRYFFDVLLRSSSGGAAATAEPEAGRSLSSAGRGWLLSYGLVAFAGGLCCTRPGAWPGITSALDGEIGHVSDFLVDEGTWTVRYLVIDTSNWIGGRSVLISVVSSPRSIPREEDSRKPTARSSTARSTWRTSTSKKRCRRSGSCKPNAAECRRW